MEQLLEKIAAYKAEIGAFTASEEKEVEAFRIRFLGTKGLVKNLMGEMKDVPAEQRKAFGQVLNDFKQFAETKFEELKANLNGHNGQQIESAAKPDLSLPGEPISIGSRHPINLVRKRVITIFQRLGFAVADGPEIKVVWYNITTLIIKEK